MLPNDLAAAIENLVVSADDEGCDGLVVVGKREFLFLVNASKHAGLNVSTHINDDSNEDAA